MFEAVTLVQTRKVKPFPIVLVGEDSYWDGLIEWISTTLVKRGKVSPGDVEILKRARGPEEVLAIQEGSSR
jgi:predicted Rossmann-fold nucleotide-binding protein